MGLDIRLPIGLMFCMLGPVVLGAGLLGEPSPVNLNTGGAMTLFGAGMLVFGWLGQRRNNKVSSTSHTPSAQ